MPNLIHSARPHTCSPTSHMQSGLIHAVRPHTCSPASYMQSGLIHGVRPHTCVYLPMQPHTWVPSLIHGCPASYMDAHAVPYIHGVRPHGCTYRPGLIHGCLASYLDAQPHRCPAYIYVGACSRPHTWAFGLNMGALEL